ncbi:unnamed protein product [Gadus morhua 'NCC']
MVLTGRLRQNSQYLKEVRGLPGLEQAVLSRRAGPWSRTSRSLCRQVVLDQARMQRDASLGKSGLLPTNGGAAEVGCFCAEPPMRATPQASCFDARSDRKAKNRQLSVALIGRGPAVGCETLTERVETAS